MKENSLSIFAYTKRWVSFHRPIKFNGPLKITMHSNGCSGTAAEIRYLEHVQLLVSLDYTRRGDLVAYLISPMGTKSCLLSPRKEDLSNEGFSKWPFMTTHSWGEDPRGTWTLEIKDLGDNRPNHGTLTEWQLILHGTKEKPHHQPISHPDKPRDSVPVPHSPSNSRITSQVPSGPTYTFGPPPVTPVSPVKYMAPSLVTYTAPPASSPDVLTLASQSVLASQVSKQTSNVNQFVPVAKQPLHVQNAYGLQGNIGIQPIFSPLRNNFLPANYRQNQIANYYHYAASAANTHEFIPQVSNPAGSQNTGQLGFQTMGWNAAAAYRNPLQFNSYSNYLRTFGRRGAGKYIEYLRSKRIKLKRT